MTDNDPQRAGLQALSAVTHNYPTTPDIAPSERLAALERKIDALLKERRFSEADPLLVDAIQIQDSLSDIWAKNGVFLRTQLAIIRAESGETQSAIGLFDAAATALRNEIARYSRDDASVQRHLAFQLAKVLSIACGKYLTAYYVQRDPAVVQKAREAVAELRELAGGLLNRRQGVSKVRSDADTHENRIALIDRERKGLGERQHELEWWLALAVKDVVAMARKQQARGLVTVQVEAEAVRDSPKYIVGFVMRDEVAAWAMKSHGGELERNAHFIVDLHNPSRECAVLVVKPGCTPIGFVSYLSYSDFNMLSFSDSQEWSA